jgi:16S rRNA (uracil1498-N3)-methyltransferase
VNLFYQPLIAEGVLHLDADESRHCVKVLRRQAGDALRITDGKGFFYDAIITQASDRQCVFRIEQQIAAEPSAAFIHIAVSPTKNADRIEWFVEKAVEIGVSRITLMECEHTERTYLKKDRLEKVAVSAMKQSLKATLPVIDGLVPFQTVINDADTQGRFIAYVDQDNPDHLVDMPAAPSYLLLIGPEGDFSQAELIQALTAGFRKVSLGKSRLRTETAALVGCHILNLLRA